MGFSCVSIELFAIFTTSVEKYGAQRLAAEMAMAINGAMSTIPIRKASFQDEIYM